MAFNPPILGPTIAFLGKGLLSPLREDPVTGDFQRISDENNVRQCLKDGILTVLGERVMNEGLGTIAKDMLFEESTVVSDLVPPSVKDFIDRFEPRVIFQQVNSTLVSENEDLVQFKISVIYIVRATNTRRNLVFPFVIRKEA